jgi:hypothetical protein
MMHPHGSLPRACQDGLLEEAVGDELLLYDRNSHTAHCLSPIAACVWRHCDGERDVIELAELSGASENRVADALRELREKDLLDAEPQLMQNAVPGESRREAIGRVARYGAAAATVPLIVSATAATPAMASSGGGSAICIPGVKGANCCVCQNEPNTCHELGSEECVTFCQEKGRGGFKVMEAEARCELIA